MILKTAQLALLLGLTTRRVNQLAEEGIMTRTAHGEFDGPASIKNYIAGVTNRAKDGETAIDKEREEARLKKEQADYWEQRNAALRKEFLPVSDVTRVWSEQISSIRGALLSVVPRVSQRLSLSHEDAEEIDAEIRDAMTKLADGVEVYDVDPDTDDDGPQGGDGDLEAATEDQPVRVDRKGNSSSGDRVARRTRKSKAVRVPEGDS